MRPVILLLLTLATAASALEGLAESERDSWRGVDKREHFAGGFAIGAFGYLMADEIHPEWPEWKKIVTGVAASAVIGAAKELYDSRHPESHDASLKDFAATTAGGALGSCSIALLFRF
jgi:uncharacterized protein YfiM (DUF2279 family)